MKASLFKNKVGRPTNEIKAKRKAFAVFVILCGVMLVSASVLLVTNFALLKGESQDMKAFQSVSDGASITPKKASDRYKITATGNSIKLQYVYYRAGDVANNKDEMVPDGILDMHDASKVLRISARLEKNVSDMTKVLADVDSDGKVTAADARLIMRMAEDAKGLPYGDVTGDKKITNKDKKLYLNYFNKKVTLNDEQKKRMDVVSDGKVDKKDYIALSYHGGDQFCLTTKKDSTKCTWKNAGYISKGTWTTFSGLKPNTTYYIYIKTFTGNATYLGSKSFNVEYTIKYDCNGGFDSTKSQKVKYGEKFILNANACSAGNSFTSFAGWTDLTGKLSWKNKYSGTWKYTNGNYGIKNNTLTLKAKWKSQLSLNKNSNAIKPTGSNKGKCRSYGIGDLMSTTHLSAGEYCSYESATLKYYIKQETNTYAITYIWAKDPYNQMKVAMSPYDSNHIFKQYMTTQIMKSEIQRKGYANKGLVGINASAMISEYFFKDLPYKWRGSSAVSLLLDDGKVIRRAGSNSDVNFITARPHKGLTKDGYLVYYYFKKNDKKKNDRTEKIIVENDKVKYLHEFSPVLVFKGKNLYDNLNEENKKKWNQPNIRQALGQVDLNNFIFITNTVSSDYERGKGLTFKQIADKMIKLGVYAGYNLDGGGSTSYFYKDNTNTLTGAGRAYDYVRTGGDILYFVEQ